jgi:hypothetical protein
MTTSRPRTAFILLFRGVGGATQLPTAPLREALTEAGFENVATYINSGNAILRSHLSNAVAHAPWDGQIESSIRFRLRQDSTIEEQHERAARHRHDDVRRARSTCFTGWRATSTAITTPRSPWPRTDGWRPFSSIRMP